MLITDGPLAGITSRAVVVLDENDKVVHAEMVPEIGQEPDYESALAALEVADDLHADRHLRADWKPYADL